MKIEEMADVFITSANFGSHALLILLPPSGSALNLKAMIKVSKVSWTSKLSYKNTSFGKKLIKQTSYLWKEQLVKARVF